MDLNSFREKGFIHLKNVIEPSLLHLTRRLSINLKKKLQPFEGYPRDYGTGFYWKGLEMASTLDEKLYPIYTSPKMLELAQFFLETDEVYLFNDQVVVKLPNEEFEFKPHFDNQFGKDPEGALRGDFKTVNFCQILTNMPLETGPLSCLNRKTNEWEVIPAKAGDIIAIEGNTLHSSTNNTSDKIRALYACVYSNAPVGDFAKGYYNIKFK